MQSTQNQAPNALLSQYGLSHYFSSEQHKNNFNSCFLAQYDTHFSTIQQIHAKNEMFKMLQSTMPDATFTRTEEQIEIISKGPSAFYISTYEELNDLTMGHLNKTGVKPAAVLKLLHRFRYMRNRGTSKALHIFMDQKFSGSGFIKGGRYAHNFRRNVRYGSFVRYVVFSMYSDVVMSFRREEEGAAGYSGHYPQYFSSGLKSRPSAFLTRRCRLVGYEKGYRQKLLVVLLSAVHALRSV